VRARPHDARDRHRDDAGRTVADAIEEEPGKGLPRHDADGEQRDADDGDGEALSGDRERPRGPREHPPRDRPMTDAAGEGARATTPARHRRREGDESHEPRAE
jgi:hypothetical protein